MLLPKLICPALLFKPSKTQTKPSKSLNYSNIPVSQSLKVVANSGYKNL